MLDLTKEQARHLETALNGNGDTAKVFISMRYWHPFSDETAEAVKGFQPDEIVLLPLYPQFSGTTTGSSLKDWHRAARAAGLESPTCSVCCYPTEPGLIDGQARLIREAMDGTEIQARPRVLFSAHSLPEKAINAGDPYASHVEMTAEAVASKLGLADSEWTICYQSRVGPLEWIGPSLDEELKRAAADTVPVVVVPIAFVSEHSETLVELDIEYRNVARDLGVPEYVRVPAIGTTEEFIHGLARVVEAARMRGVKLCSADGERICPGKFRKCPNTGSAGAADRGPATHVNGH